MEPLVAIELSRPSSFDPRQSPEKELLADCVHCGFCLPACPTYVLWGEEMDSPRGRIYMMAKAAQGEAPLDQNFRTHMDNCLGCMACMTACPSGVQYNKLIEDTRAQVERNIPRPTGTPSSADSSSPRSPTPRACALAGPLFLYQRSGLQTLIRGSGLLKLVPKRFAAMEALLPTVPAHFTWNSPSRVAPAAAPPRRHADRLRPAGLLLPRQRRHRARPRRRRLRGHHPRESALLRSSDGPSGLEEQAAAMARSIIALFERPASTPSSSTPPAAAPP